MTINPLTTTNNTARHLSIPVNAQPPQTNNNAPAKISVQSAQPVQLAQSSDPASADQVQEAVEQIKNATDKLAQNLQFSIDDDTGITVVKIVDTQTQEVIRQFPTEEAVSIARTLDKVQGLLFNDKA